MEKAIADTKEAYYAALQKADQNWYEGENDPKPFIKYMLGIVLSCYRDLETRIMLTKKVVKKVLHMISLRHIQIVLLVGFLKKMR